MSAVPFETDALTPPMMRLRGFHPGWYGAVMGTAIVGIIAYQNPGQIGGLADLARGFGVVMVGLSAVLAILLGIPYVARWIGHPDAACADLANPVAGALYGTFPGGILVLAVGIATVGPSVGAPGDVALTVGVLAGVGLVLAFAVSVIFAHLLFVSHPVGPELANGAWFIPPVVNIVVPLALLPVAAPRGPRGCGRAALRRLRLLGHGVRVVRAGGLAPLRSADLPPTPGGALGALAVDRSRADRGGQPGAAAERAGGGVPVRPGGAPGDATVLLGGDGPVGFRDSGGWPRRSCCWRPICVAAKCPTGSDGGASRSRSGPTRRAHSLLRAAGNWASWRRQRSVCSCCCSAFWLVVSAGTLRALASGEVWRR